MGIASIACAALASPREANAQERPALDMRTWRPSTDPNASLVIEPAITPGPGVLTLGAYGHYAFHPVSLRNPRTDDVALRPLAHALGVDAIANLGIGQRLAVGLSIPVLLYQDGSEPLPKTISSLSRVPAAGFGDLGMSLKGALVRNEQGGFGLAALGYVSLPTGDPAGFTAESAPTVSARILAEYTLLVAVAQASLGYKLRTEHHTWPDASTGGIRFGDEVPWTFGLALRPGILGIDPGNRQRLEVGFHGWLPAGPVGPFGTGAPGSASLSPVQLALSDRIELGHYRDAFVTIGGELGLTQAVGVPAFRAIVGIGFTPRAHDLDGDGVKDDIDGCPEIPEDKDGFEDSDGCPEIDNDDDGIIDREDACPNVKGASSNDRTKNGCPSADTDGDGIEDAGDACPSEKGHRSSDPKRNGCPSRDSDGDGIDDAADKCPTQAEDRDGFQDDDGCPDPDNDADGIADKEDACPEAKGDSSTDPARNGCPNPDRDGDTFPNDEDRCPDGAEVFNGVDDQDGCPDEGGKPLVVIDDKRNVRLTTPLKVLDAKTGDATAPPPDVDPSSVTTLRALALELNRHPEWTLAVGARPGTGEGAQLDALAKSFAVVRVLSNFSRRDGIAETVGWDAVKYQPQAQSGLGFRLLVLPASSGTTPTAPSTPIPALPKPKP
ncbi:MAG TPA: thrombospondin type 3 repeat-containing protein [Labilithrix sp.]|nr:thrombospondin type 3 repeat-containing protein [Labilithrix sp.]